jgi:hypothetical protein
MKKLILIISSVVVAISLNSCIAGYVATEPSYVEYSRPVRPTTTSIWIDGDWNWSIQTHTYVQQNGYWDRPRSNQSYRAGYWQQTPKGKSWSKGRWEKDNNGNNNNKGKGNNRRGN